MDENPEAVQALLVDRDNGVVTVTQAPMVNAGTNVVQSFGQDGAGELYILTADGRVLRIVRQ